MYKYNTAKRNGKLYITGWDRIKGKPDNIEIFAEPCDMKEPWQYILEKQSDGTFKKVFDPIQFTTEEKEAKRAAEVDQQIQAKLPELMRIIANDDTKGFDDLKVEIKAIDQSVTLKEPKRAKF